MEDLVTPSPFFWKGKRVLLTGHTGFKGTWCALWLRHLGAEVVGLALPPSTAPSMWELTGRPADAGAFVDIRDAEKVGQAVIAFAPEIVIHMAAQALVHPSYRDPAATFDTNVMGLVHVLDAVRSTPSVRAVVNVTSDKCYENTEQVWAYRETEPMGGSDPYSASKGCAELVTSCYRRSFFEAAERTRLASARAGNVIGGGDWSDDRLLPDCVRAFAAGQPVHIRNPSAVRPWQHVLEPLSGYFMLAQALFEGGGEFAEAWNFGPHDFDAWTVQRVVETFAGLWGAGARVERDATAWAKESMLLRVDAAKARLHLGWRPRLTIAESLDWTFAWYRAVLDGRSAFDVSLEQIGRYEEIVTDTRALGA